MFKTWEELEKNAMQCRECKLCNNRKNVVIGEGNRNAKIMFIGEGPGADEDETRNSICRKGSENL